ncbi:MAG: TIGR00159 family protein [Ruminococcaceae bacterium]|nr:TIGR00159 family protein [Oscillospiraceae bacterium]
MNEYISNLISTFKGQLKALSFGLNDFFDIFIVAVLLYYVYKFIRNRRAGKLAIGLGVILLVKVLSDIFSLKALGFIISNFFQIGLLAIVILFQPELRSALEQAGGTSLKGLKNLGEKHAQNTEQLIEAVCDAACEMAKEKTGALIVFENRTGLNDIISSGTVINADMSSFLLRNIFFENTPLHDGAVVVRDGRIYAAGCFLPLSENTNIAKELGTRHRAAIGMSEISDALVLVVSEETGCISLAEDGVIRRNFGYGSLKKALNAFLNPDEEETPKKRFKDIAKKKFERNDKPQKNNKKKKTESKVNVDKVGLELFDGDAEE